MIRIVSRPLIGSVLAMTLGLGTGCSHWIELAAPTDAVTPANATVATDARVPLLLETIRVTHNGSSIAPPAIIERQVLGAIEATRLFSQHYQSGYMLPTANQARVTVRLSIENLVEPHAGQAAWRSFLIGASMFTLSPFVSLNNDYGATMSVVMERSDGPRGWWLCSRSMADNPAVFAIRFRGAGERVSPAAERCSWRA